MGLYDELNKINRSILAEKQEKAETNRLKELERIKKQEEKENLQFLNDKIKSIIRQLLETESKDNMKYLLKFYLIDNKKYLYKYIIKNKKNYNLSIFADVEIEEVFNNYYYKILYNYKKELEMDSKERERQLEEENIVHFESLPNYKINKNNAKRKPFIDSLGWLHLLNKILK